MATREIGSRVKIHDQPGSLGEVFNGQTGTIIGTERDGRTMLYRVRLHEPVNVDGLGTVEDDLWAGVYLKGEDQQKGRESRFLALRQRWIKSRDRAMAIRSQVTLKYGTWYIHAPRGQRERVETANASEDKASEAIFAWLDTNSPRSWRTGVPAHWVCESLTYADAITAEQLSVIPPQAYGSYPSDPVRFARPVEQL